MPCNSDYMQPTAFELKILETTKLLAYLLKATDRSVPPVVAELAAGRQLHRINRETGHEIVASLCTEMHALTPETLERVVYQARNRDARRLADWWEEHQAADHAREAAASKAKLDRGFLFPKGSGVPKEKKHQMMAWYNKLGSEGQSYVNLLLLVRDNARKVSDVSKD